MGFSTFIEVNHDYAHEIGRNSQAVAHLRLRYGLFLKGHEAHMRDCPAWTPARNAADEAADRIEALSARVAELEGICYRISSLSAGGPHPSASDAVTALADTLDLARIIAADALKDTQS